MGAYLQRLAEIGHTPQLRLHSNTILPYYECWSSQVLMGANLQRLAEIGHARLRRRWRLSCCLGLGEQWPGEQRRGLAKADAAATPQGSEAAAEPDEARQSLPTPPHCKLTS